MSRRVFQYLLSVFYILFVNIDEVVGVLVQVTELLDSPKWIPYRQSLSIFHS